MPLESGLGDPSYVLVNASLRPNEFKNEADALLVPVCAVHKAQSTMHFSESTD